MPSTYSALCAPYSAPHVRFAGYVHRKRAFHSVAFSSLGIKCGTFASTVNIAHSSPDRLRTKIKKHQFEMPAVMKKAAAKAKATLATKAPKTKLISKVSACNSGVFFVPVVIECC